MKERIKAIRIAQRNNLGKKMTQAEFAEDLGVSQPSITAFETGNRIPSDSVINLICMKYGISKTWLLTGEGNMTATKTKEVEIEELAEQLFNEKDPFRKQLFKMISGMGKDELEAAKKLKDYIDENFKEEGGEE